MREKLNTFMDEPWYVVNTSMAEYLNAELVSELSSEHILNGKESIAVARRCDNDEVVYWIPELNKFAVVHLTYCKENSSEYPKTKLFTFCEFEKHCKEVSNFY